MTKTSSVRLSWLVAAVVVISLAVIAFWILSGNSRPVTDDAFVSADSTLVAPRISGTVAEVYVQDNQSVKAGDVLAKIDDRDYRNAVLTAEANLETANAQMLSLTAQLAKQQQTILQAQALVNSDAASIAYARQSADRYTRLLQNGSGTADARDESDANLRAKLASQQSDIAAALGAEKQVDVLKAEQAQAKAGIDSAATALAQAKLNLSYTEITAPVDGVVGQRSLRVGGYVSAGTRVLAIVPLKDAYIVANYLETQLGDVHTGQPVEIKVDALPGVVLKGKVDSISPATGVTFSPISPDNATGNYTKVVQRLAVKIVLDAHQPDARRLKVGMSVIPSIQTGRG
jgi:membrane fusion protein (multidrug efflux system)